MENLHFITGLPRSGSTLLCNILNQNPEFYASSTSPLPAFVNAIVNTASRSEEMKSELIGNEELTNKRMTLVIKSLIVHWYAENKEKIIFDKSRGWSFESLLIADLLPGSRFILCVRDMRGVFGSVEKQHAKNPHFDLATNPNEKTILDRADKMLSPNGFIGQCVIGSNDLYARVPNRVYVLNYESFVRNPEMHLSEIYEFLKLDKYAHDFENVQNVSTDKDGLYHNKFPHKGEGKVIAPPRQAWQEYIPQDLAQTIFARYPQYNKNFGYLQ